MDYKLIDKIIPPRTEQEVVFLFALVNPEYLHWEITRVQSEFPDCSALINAGDKQKEVKMEFKLKAINCRDDRTGRCQTANILVCWENNWNNPPKNLQIVELKQYLNKNVQETKEWMCKDFRRLSKINQRILQLFAKSKDDIIPFSKISKEIKGPTGKRLGSFMANFTKHRKEWILREDSREKGDTYWLFNEKYRERVKECFSQ